MTSRSSFFDLMRENLKRRIALPALITVVFFFVFPVSTLMVTDNYMRNPATAIGGAADWMLTKRYIHDDFIKIHDAGGTLFALICVLAVVSGVSAFRYLHNARKTDFYHSLPVSRTKLYITAILNSILMTGVPYLIMAMASAAVTQAKTGYTDCLSYAGVNFLCGMSFFALILMTTVLAMMLTGTLLTGIMGTLVLLFYGPIVVCMIDSLMQNYYWSFYRINATLDSWCAHTSSVMWVAIGDGSTAYKAVIAIIAALLLLALSLRLYIMRHSESAGTPMAFSLTKAPVKILITVPAGLMGGIFAGSMTERSDIWTVFGMLCGVLLVHSIIEIIYNADFRKLFSHRLQLAICLAATFLIWGFYRFDISGYDSYLPDTDKVESYAAYSYGLENVYGNENNLKLSDDGDSIYTTHDRNEFDVLNDMQVTDETLGQHIMDIAKEGITQVKGFKAEGDRNEASDYMSDEQRLSIINIAWHMTNGKTVYRTYSFDWSKVSADIEAVHDSLDFKQAVYPLLKLTEQEAADIVEVNYQDAFGVHSFNFKATAHDDEIEELYYTYAKELSQLTANTRKQESPIASIQFRSRHFQELADAIQAKSGYTSYMDDFGYYPIYPSFKETIAKLRDYGIVLNEWLDAEHIESIELKSAFADMLQEDGGEAASRTNLVVIDKEQIQEILDSLIYYVGTDNNIDRKYYGLYANINFADAAGTDGNADIAYGDSADKPVDTSFVNGLNFAADRIPQFVKDYFDIDEDMLRLNTQSSAW